MIRTITPKARFFQASSSEIYGKPVDVPQAENTPFLPRSPYGVSKMCGHPMAMTYRENYNLFACSGILYNHESPRRSPEFVTRKITRAAAKLDYFLVLPWHFLEEFRLREKAYLLSGGKFIVPMPHFTLI